MLDPYVQNRERQLRNHLSKTAKWRKATFPLKTKPPKFNDLFVAFGLQFARRMLTKGKARTWKLFSRLRMFAKLAPWARVVKAIPPFAEVLHSGKTLLGDSPPAVFVCGDDAEARKVIASLVEDIGGAPVNAGPLNLARYTEPAAMLLVQLAYVHGFGARIGLTLSRDTSQPAAKQTTP